MKEKSVCFIGHRQLLVTHMPWLATELKSVIVKLIEDGYTRFYTGSALGFDILAAQTVLELKETYPHIQLCLVLPCLLRTEGWDFVDKSTYEKIKRLADTTTYTSMNYTRWCIPKRNRYLVNHSSVCVCYLTQKKSKTYRMLRYAKLKRRKIIHMV